jgi:hypothetical protein
MGFIACATATVIGRTRNDSICALGDGVWLRVLRNMTVVQDWTHLPPSLAYTPVNVQTPVQAGDTIQFQVNRDPDNGCDHTDWNMSVRYFVSGEAATPCLFGRTGTEHPVVVKIQKSEEPIQLKPPA